jgi:hypothetical protein
VLSPAAYEINKRYNFNHGGGVDRPLLDLIPSEAVWGLYILRRVRGYLPGG